MFALKVINVFEIEKRKQMMQEILMMCDARCDSIIRFYGAFYNEGTISVVLEYMSAGGYSPHVIGHRLCFSRFLEQPSRSVLKLTSTLTWRDHGRGMQVV